VKYINELLRLKCASDLIGKRLFPNAKEITESMAACAAAHERFRADLSNRAMAAMVVGDGHVPRTGAVFAYRSAWTVYSIDPKMRAKWLGNGHGISRLHAYDCRIEDLHRPLSPMHDRIVVVAVHSHASLSHSVAVARRFADQVDVISIPCCVPDDLPQPSESYVDTAISSPCRQVNIWRDVGVVDQKMVAA